MFQIFSSSRLLFLRFVRVDVCNFLRVEGTGDIIKVSTCNKRTSIKVKMSVFTGSCTDLKCVTGGAESDYECSDCQQQNQLGQWDTYATALTFHSKLGADYYILVQQDALYRRGTIWLNFQTPIIPQNDNCVDAIGPVPRDMTTIDATSIFGTISKVDDYCGGEFVPALYPGTWFQSELSILSICYLLFLER